MRQGSWETGCPALFWGLPGRCRLVGAVCITYRREL
jgi:hypothetical protein